MKHKPSFNKRLSTALLILTTSTLMLYILAGLLRVIVINEDIKDMLWIIIIMSVAYFLLTKDT